MPMQLTGRDPMIAKMRSEEFSATKQAVLLFYRGSSSRKKERGKGGRWTTNIRNGGCGAGNVIYIPVGALDAVVVVAVVGAVVVVVVVAVSRSADRLIC